MDSLSAFNYSQFDTIIALDTKEFVAITESNLMSEDKFKNRYRIPSARANWHDYLGGAYFVMICTKDREFYFGKIEDNQMHLSEIGRYADVLFRDVSVDYPYAVIPSYVVMPNHIHAIVIIDDHYDACRDAIHRVSTRLGGKGKQWF